MKLVIAMEAAEQLAWLAPTALAARAITAVPFWFLPDEQAAAAVGGRRIPCRAAAGTAPLLPQLPSFSQVLGGIAAEQADACLVFGDSPATRLLALAADLLAVPVFYLVTTAEHLGNLSERPKPMPDLFFLADQELFPQALLDRRYGSTLLPTGHPGRDGWPPAAAAAQRWGGGQGGARLLSAIERWRERSLDPPRPALSVIVPAFREAANLPLVCDRLLAALNGRVPSFEILVVDDASPDDTYRVALEQMWRSPRIRALTKAPPRGMGNAVRHGLERSRADVLAITMGDGSDEVDCLPDMFARVRHEGFGLAIGSRYRHRRNYQTVPRLYRFWSWCFRWCTRVVLGLRLSDYTNAFRVFDRRAFARYGPESGGFEISPEITFKAWFATRMVTEVDVRHLKRASGQSNFSFLRAGPGYGKVLIKAFVHRLTGRWFTLDW